MPPYGLWAVSRCGGLAIAFDTYSFGDSHQCRFCMHEDSTWHAFYGLLVSCPHL